MATETPTPRERFEQVSTRQMRPSELRAALLELLVELGNERVEIRKTQEDISTRIGRAAHRAAECGLSYEQQAPRTGIDRNAIYRAASVAVGPVNYASAEPKSGEVARLVRKLKALAPQRLANNDALTANSAGLAALVHFLHHELNVSVQELAENGQLYRSTVYGWIKADPDSVKADDDKASPKAGKTYVRPRTADTPYTRDGRKWTGKK